MSQPEFPTVNKSGNRRGMHLFKHGFKGTRTYRIWCKMKERVMVEYQGQRKTVAQWCRELSLDYNIVRQRIYRNKWTPERAFAR